MSLEEIDAAIRELELQIGPTLARISTLKKAARLPRAAFFSVLMRARVGPICSSSSRIAASISSSDILWTSRQGFPASDGIVAPHPALAIGYRTIHMGFANDLDGPRVVTLTRRSC